MTPTFWACLLAISVGWAARPRVPVRRPDASGPSGPSEVDHRSSAPAGRGRRANALVPLRRPPRPRRRSDEAVELARWCEALARAVRGGDTLRNALGRIAAPNAHAERLATLTRVGARPSDRGDGGPDVAVVLAVVTACLEHGGPAAEPLDRAAGVLRSRAAERAERRVQSAQARMSATVLTWLPVAVLGVMVATSPAVRRVVVSPIGMTVVTLGGVVNLVGWWWMRRIVERAAR